MSNNKSRKYVQNFAHLLESW